MQTRLLTHLPFPLDASLKATLNHQAIIYLRSDWETPTGSQYKAGSVIALDLKTFLHDATLKLSLVFAPTESCIYEEIVATKEYLMLVLLNNVRSEIHRYQLMDDQWISSRLPLPDM